MRLLYLLLFLPAIAVGQIYHPEMEYELKEIDSILVHCDCKAVTVKTGKTKWNKIRYEWQSDSTLRLSLAPFRKPSYFADYKLDNGIFKAQNVGWGENRTTDDNGDVYVQHWRTDSLGDTIMLPTTIVSKHQDTSFVYRFFRSDSSKTLQYYNVVNTVNDTLYYKFYSPMITLPYETKSIRTETDFGFTWETWTHQKDRKYPTYKIMQYIVSNNRLTGIVSPMEDLRYKLVYKD